MPYRPTDGQTAPAAAWRIIAEPASAAIENRRDRPSLSGTGRVPEAVLSPERDPRNVGMVAAAPTTGHGPVTGQTDQLGCRL